MLNNFCFRKQFKTNAIFDLRSSVVKYISFKISLFYRYLKNMLCLNKGVTRFTEKQPKYRISPCVSSICLLFLVHAMQQVQVIEICHRQLLWITEYEFIVAKHSCQTLRYTPSCTFEVNKGQGRRMFYIHHATHFLQVMKHKYI